MIIPHYRNAVLPVEALYSHSKLALYLQFYLRGGGGGEMAWYFLLTFYRGLL